jgi:endo-1,4-beta-xylanase
MRSYLLPMPPHGGVNYAGKFSLPMVSRRQTLSTAFSLVGALATAPLAQRLAAAETAHTAALATRRSGPADGRVPYGTCVRPDPMDNEPDYRLTLESHCQQLTPEGGLFWGYLRPTRDQFKFDFADRVLAFADAHAMTMRGHTLVWYDAMPGWTKDIRSSAEAEHELVKHIEHVVSRYRGRIKTWHVVNEPIDDVKGGVAGLRPNVWLQNLGERYIDLAFRTAHRVDPSAELLLNEHGVEGRDPVSPKRRQAYLKLIHDLLERGVPLHGVGLQGHILGKYQIDRDGMFEFVSEIRSLGLSVHVTELDVIDHDLPGPAAVRDTIVAARSYDFLDSIFAAMRPSVVATWGITDRYTWVPTTFKRKDGLPNRPLPFDEFYRPKPMWNVIDYFCRLEG